MRRCFELGLVVCLTGLGCGRTNAIGLSPGVRLPDGGTLHVGNGTVVAGPSGVSGTSSSRGTGANAAPVRPDAGPGGFAGQRGGAAGVMGAAGRPGFGTGGSTIGGGGTPGLGTAGVTGAAGFMGTGGSIFIGSGGSAPVQTCVYFNGTCMYPNGGTCNSLGYCCAISNNRCCDGSGLCSAPLPPPPAWVPPVAAASVGAPGWKMSTDPLCFDMGTVGYATSVWSDSRGVFVASTLNQQNYDPSQKQDPNCLGCPVEDIYFNGGSGWTLVAGGAEYGQQRLRGFDAGPLVLYGYSQFVMKSNTACGLSLLKDGVRTCEPVDGVSDVAVVRSDLAYAALQGDLVRYDGSHWGPVTAIFPGQHELNMIWADATVVLGTGSSAGKIYSLSGDTWKLLDTRTLDTFTTIWGFSPTDVWAGTQQEHLFHYDGTTWTQVSWPGSGCSQQSGIVSMWGSGGVLYFATATALARYSGSGTPQVIAQWACDSSQGAPTIAALWGNSADEVFIAIQDTRDPRQTCGMTFLLYYDGSKFHRM